MNLDWPIFCKSTTGAAQLAGCFGHGGETSYLQWLLSAWGWTAAVAVCGFLLALAAGITIGTMRTLGMATRKGTSGWIHGLHSRHVSVAFAAFAVAWTELFRNVPLLVQVFLWYHVLPYFVPALKAMPAWLLASAALGLFTSARIAEQVRSGIQSLSRGQRNAGYAVGLTQVQTYRYVLLPMAYRIIIPPLTSELMNLIKNTAVAYSIGLTELFFRTREMGEMTFRYFEAFAAATLVYVIIALTANRVMALIERRVAVPGFITGNH